MKKPLQSYEGRMISDVPHGVEVAARGLVMGLARALQPYKESARRTQPTPTTPYVHNHNAVGSSHRALVALFQLEGGRIMVRWYQRFVTVNDVVLELNEAISAAAGRLHESLSVRGVAGLIFRQLPDREQFHRTLQMLNNLTPEHSRRLGVPGQVVALPGLEESGVQALLGTPGQMPESQTSIPSILGLRASFEEIVREERLDWIGATHPDLHHRSQRLQTQHRQRLALSAYTHLVTTTQHLLRLSSHFMRGPTPLPTLAMHRVIQQVAVALSAAPELMKAAMLLSARDPSPARRLAHAVLTTVGLGVHAQLSPDLIAEQGLASFVYGVRLRMQQLVEEPISGWNILQLLGREEVLTRLKLRAVQAAALVGQRLTDTSIKLPAATRIVQLSADFAAGLDGTLGGQISLAPLPTVKVVETLQRRLVNHPEALHYDMSHLHELAEWFGPLPCGTLIELVDQRVAVVMPMDAAEITARPLFDAHGKPITLSNEIVAVGRYDARHLRLTQLKLKGVVIARPFTNAAARALFHEALPLLS